MRIVAADAGLLRAWREIHNQIIPAAPLTEAEVAERSTRNRLTVALDEGRHGEVVVGNATVRPPVAGVAVATVIVRILPEHRNRGLGTAYLTWALDDARSLGATRVETVVLAPNVDGLRFAVRHGFVEHDRYVLPGGVDEFVDLHLVGSPD